MKKLNNAAQLRIEAAGRRFQKKMQSIMKKNTNIESITMQAGDDPDATITERKKRRM